MKGIGLNRNSIKENVQTDNQHVKRCWNHQSLDKYKWKPEWVSLCPLGRLLANKQNDQCLSLRRYRNWNVCAGQVVTQRGSVTRENSVEVWEKLQTELLWPAIPPPDTHPEQSRPDMTVPLWPRPRQSSHDSPGRTPSAHPPPGWMHEENGEHTPWTIPPSTGRRKYPHVLHLGASLRTSQTLK